MKTHVSIHTCIHTYIQQWKRQLYQDETRAVHDLEKKAEKWHLRATWRRWCVRVYACVCVCTMYISMLL